MKRILIALVAIALLSVPAVGWATKPANKPGNGHGNSHGQDKAKDKAKGNAYGKYCKGESKKHVKGEKGTAFSRCVKAMKKVVEQDASPKKACKGLSKKHVKGQKGTPFSVCVKAGAQMLKDRQAQS